MAEAHNNRGVVLTGLRQLEMAMESYDQAIQIQPDYAEAYSNRGNALTELGQLEAAVTSYNRAIELIVTCYLIRSIKPTSTLSSTCHKPKNLDSTVAPREQRPQPILTRKTQPNLRLAWSPPTLATIPAVISVSVH